MANFTARKIRVCSWSLPDVSPPSSACELHITAAKSPLFSISATYSPPMEVNPCKKCGRPVSVHAEYCPYCGCVVDRRPFVPASTSKPLGGGSTPAPSAPVSRPVAPPPPATPSPTSAPTAAATPSPELQAVERLSEELGVAPPKPPLPLPMPRRPKAPRPLRRQRPPLLNRLRRPLRPKCRLCPPPRHLPSLRPPLSSPRPTRTTMSPAVPVVE